MTDKEFAAVIFTAAIFEFFVFSVDLHQLVNYNHYVKNIKD